MINNISGEGAFLLVRPLAPRHAHTSHELKSPYATSPLPSHDGRRRSILGILFYTESHKHVEWRRRSMRWECRWNHGDDDNGRERWRCKTWKCGKANSAFGCLSFCRTDITLLQWLNCWTVWTVIENTQLFVHSTDLNCNTIDTWY